MGKNKDKKGKQKKKKGGKKSEEKESLAQARMATTERLRKRLDIKKKIVEGWVHEHAAPLTSPEKLADMLEKLGVLPLLLLSIHSAGANTGPKKLKAAEHRMSDSTVSISDLPKALRTTLAAKLFDFFDLNHNGLVDQEEVILVLSALVVSDPEEKAEFAFMITDKNHDGKLNSEELEWILHLKLVALKVMFEMETGDAFTELGPEEEVEECKRLVEQHFFDNPKVLATALRHLMDHADTDHDGLVSLKEYVDWGRDKASIKALRKDLVARYERRMGDYTYPSKAMEKLVKRTLNMAGGRL